MTTTQCKKSYRVQVEFLRGDTLAAQVVSIYGLLICTNGALSTTPRSAGGSWRVIRSG